MISLMNGLVWWRFVGDILLPLLVVTAGLAFTVVGDIDISSSLVSVPGEPSGGVFSNVLVMIGPPAAERSSTSSFGGGSLPWNVFIS